MPFAAALPIIAIVTSVAGAAMSAVGSIQQGQAQSASLKAQAEAARYNQNVANQNAQMVMQSQAYNEQIQREKNQRLLASQKAAYGKAGVTMAGSPLDVQADTTFMMEQDILSSRYNAQIKSWQYQSQAGLMGLEASQYSRMSQYPVVGGYLGAGSTLLTGAAKGAMIYGSMSGAGKSTSLGLEGN